ncbi:MAG: immunoglobulin domain-containing protein [Verrucomicrobiales bacterium]|nr:immunoglobulin domain-containing protein [Verrucomicrobiales bacterium]
MLVPPSLISSPASVTAKVGEAVSLTVSAEGTAPLSYQWQKDGVAVSGAVSSVLTWSAVNAADAGRYSVVVSNVAGVVTSAEAVLTVLVPPRIIGQPEPTRLVLKAGASGVLTAVVEGTAPMDVQWFKDGVALAGATGLSLDLGGAEAATAGTYSLEVSNSAGNVRAAMAEVGVWSDPVIRHFPAESLLRVRVIAAGLLRVGVEIQDPSVVGTDWVPWSGSVTDEGQGVRGIAIPTGGAGAGMVRIRIEDLPGR